MVILGMCRRYGARNNFFYLLEESFLLTLLSVFRRYAQVGCNISKRDAVDQPMVVFYEIKIFIFCF